MSVGFGDFIRKLRLSKNIGLRQYCLTAKVDPSNWSKVERGVIAPPTDSDTLLNISKALGIEHGSSQWHELTNKAFLDRGLIPKEVMDNEELMAALPVFFRTARGEKPDKAELEQLVEIIKRS